MSSLLGLQHGTAPMYGLKLAARALCGVPSRSSHFFLVGTCSAKEENEVQLLEFAEEENEIKQLAVYQHAQEIWNISANPHEPSVCATSYPVDSSTWQATLWRIPNLSSVASTPSSPASRGSAPSTLQRIVDLKGHQGKLKSVVWNSLEGERSLLTLDSEALRVWEMNEASTELKGSATVLSSNSTAGPSAGAWDPHHSRQLASGEDRSLKLWDLRSGTAPSSVLENVHEDLLTDVDYNPNKPFHLLTASQDRRIHLWDLRKPHQPLKTCQGHSHWVWSAKFNRFHDQLLLTAGTERVNLWNVISMSSAPIGELEATGTSAGVVVDTLIKTYSDHEDSVYAAAWSAYDAWIFATLSYDGRIVVNHVPPAEKYRILL